MVEWYFTMRVYAFLIFCVISMAVIVWTSMSAMLDTVKKRMKRRKQNRDRNI